MKQLAEAVGAQSDHPNINLEKRALLRIFGQMRLVHGEACRGNKQRCKVGATESATCWPGAVQLYHPVDLPVWRRARRARSACNTDGPDDAFGI